MPDGYLSAERFFVAPDQSAVTEADCLLIIHERTGESMMVRDTRLFPAEAVSSSPLGDIAIAACLTGERLNGSGQTYPMEAVTEPVVLALVTVGA